MSEEKTMRIVILLMLLSGISQFGYAAKKLKPFVLASSSGTDMNMVSTQTRKALKNAGFSIVGEYSPYSGARIIIVTSPYLKKAAEKSKMGGFGAVQRVSITRVGRKIQVAYTNPEYMANVYRMQDSLSVVAKKLERALGRRMEFGRTAGLTAAQLRKYHYKVFMPYFDEPYKLGKFRDHHQAVQKIEQNLARRVGGTSKVYRVDLTGNKTVIGIGLTKKCGADRFIMKSIDTDKLRSTPHLPYEILVSNGQVLALHPKFRIAQSFPGLGMIGSNSFFSIRCAPDDIKTSLLKIVN